MKKLFCNLSYLNILLFAGLLMLSNLLIGCESSPDAVLLYPTPTAFPPSVQVLSSTLNLAEQWRVQTGLSNSNLSIPPFLMVTGEKVIISTFLEKPDRGIDRSVSLLTAFSIKDGRIVWQTQYKNAGNTIFIDDILMQPEDNRLYLVYSTMVSAFNLDTGEQLWISSPIKGGTHYYFAPELSNENQLVLRSTLRELNRIDPQTGALLAQEFTNDPFETAVHDQIRLSNSYSVNAVKTTMLTATDRDNGQVIWQKIASFLAFSPVFVDHGVLLAYASRNARLQYSYKYLALGTGEVIWETDQNYISNIALSGDLAYVLSHEGSLIAIDLYDGHSLGELKFDREITNLSRPHWVAASGPYVLAYFSDSQELIAFKQDH